VFGGSWGSTLSLAYAITHPERVSALVLRGIFLLTRKELLWFYQDGASMLVPDAWERFVAPIPEAERGDLMGAYYKRLTGDDEAAKTECAIAWSSWEGETARIECWYFMNRGFFPEEDWIIKNIGRIRHIPGWITQGRFDVVTPMSGAWALHRAWPEATLEVIPDAGHASSEPGIVDSLIRATGWAVGV
jgi:proline iminopeptidase